MLNRYIGNKKVLLDPIVEAVDSRADRGDLVCDIFTGSLAVALTLKSHGYRVAANDANFLSAIYGRAFLLSSSPPATPVNTLVPRIVRERCRERATSILNEVSGDTGYRFVENGVRDRYFDILTVIAFLEDCSLSGLPKAFRRSDFFDHYCEEGQHSAFVSSRGTEGRRRFFIPENARRIDAVLNYLRYWHQNGLCDPTLLSLLLTSLVDGVEKVSNTQGTYHDFPRDQYDSRALKSLRLIPPAYDGILGTREDHILGVAEDSLHFIRRVPDHSILYIDPPYNFRQYAAYYFLPNLIGRYPEMRDPTTYFDGVQFVRGQNPTDAFSSTFCSKGGFLPSLAELIARARARTIILSYFDGRNHWNDFKVASNGRGFVLLNQFFESELFRRGSLRVVPISRRNYQSYGGHKAKDVLEYLFIADKAA